MIAARRFPAGVRALAAASLAAVMALFGCGLDPSAASIVNSPRVLAIIAEPSDARPGDEVPVRVIFGGTSERARFEWTVCTRPDETTTALPLSSFGQFNVDRGCDSDGAYRIAALGTGTATRVRVPSDALTNIDLLRAAYGSLPVDTLLRLARETGVIVIVQVTLTDGATTLRAYKRIYVTGDPMRPLNRNPPPPSFSFAGQPMAYLGNDACERADHMPLEVDHGAAVRLEPAAGESEWLETYQTLDTEGRWVEQREDAFYDMYSTSGAWDRGRARMPDRNPQWTAPAMPGSVTHWMVVRDGRGGASACRFTVGVR